MGVSDSGGPNDLILFVQGGQRMFGLSRINPPKKLVYSWYYSFG